MDVLIDDTVFTKFTKAQGHLLVSNNRWESKFQFQSYKIILLYL